MWKPNKDKIIPPRIFLIGILLCCALSLNVVASNHTWGSTGDVIYDKDGNKTILFDVEDLDYLDNRIDEIEASVLSGKLQLANNLNQWEVPSDKLLSTTNPTFDQINSTLEYIKSVPNEGQVFTDTSGSPLYLKADGSVTTNSSEAASSNPIAYTAATSQSLSAGSVAWINGSLVIGLGTDNNNYYNLGYANGLKEINNASIVYTYHSHSESGCTSTTNTISTSCGGRLICAGSYSYDQNAGRYNYRWYCARCGKNYYWGGVSSGTYYCSQITSTKDEIVWSCGKVDGQMEAATILF